MNSEDEKQDASHDPESNPPQIEQPTVGGPDENNLPQIEQPTDSGRDEAAPKLIEVTFPTRITPFVGLAMGVGLVLVAVAVAGSVAGWGLKASGSLLLAAGIAIILAAFGGQATVRGKIYVVAGVAALAVLLVAFLEERRSADRAQNKAEIEALAKEYARGSVHDVPADEFSVSLKFARDVLGNTDLYGKQFSFVVFQGEAEEAEVASLTLEPRNSNAEPISIGIPTSCFTSAMGGKPLDWKMEEINDSYEILDRRRDRVIGIWGNADRPEPCETTITSAETHPVLAGLLFGNDQALAQTSEPTGPEPLPVDLTKIAVDLVSDVADIRRAARDELSLAPPAQIPAILDMARNDPETYRVKLGVTVALTEMLRRDKSQRSLIIPVLTDQDRDLLLDYAADQDRTLRIYATEFLFDLGDPAVTMLAIPRAATTESDIARYNWLFVAQDGWWRLDTASKDDLRPLLKTAFEQSGEKTRELFKAFEE